MLLLLPQASRLCCGGNWAHYYQERAALDFRAQSGKGTAGPSVSPGQAVRPALMHTLGMGGQVHAAALATAPRGMLCCRVESGPARPS